MLEYLDKLFDNFAGSEAGKAESVREYVDCNEKKAAPLTKNIHSRGDRFGKRFSTQQRCLTNSYNYSCHTGKDCLVRV